MNEWVEGWIWMDYLVTMNATRFCGGEVESDDRDYH